MTPSPAIDVLVVSVSGTLGWRVGSEALAAAFAQTGARTLLVRSGPAREVRTLMATDLVQALAARRLAARAIARHRPRAIVYASVTAALLWPAPGAIWLDATAHANRPGRHGLWQRPTERRRLAAATLLLTWSPRTLEGLADADADALADAVVVPPIVEPSSPAPLAAPARDIVALTYAADPDKRQLAFVLDAWERARQLGEELVVAGLERPARPGVRFVGQLSSGDYRGLVRRTRVVLAAPRREDHGIAALEALADGAMLVTTPAPGPYEALALARALDPRLVSEELSGAIRRALDDPAPGYAERARALTARYRAQSVSAVLSADVLPRLLAGWGR